jgi:hypothetical protein
MSNLLGLKRMKSYRLHVVLALIACLISSYKDNYANYVGFGNDHVGIVKFISITLTEWSATEINRIILSELPSFFPLLMVIFLVNSPYSRIFWISFALVMSIAYAFYTSIGDRKGCEECMVLYFIFILVQPVLAVTTAILVMLVKRE